MNAGAPGRAVVVTRAEASDGPLSRELKDLGLNVLVWPAVSVTRADPQGLRTALAAAGRFDWIVFASRHAVAAVLSELPQAPAGVKIAAIGAATAQVLRQRGWPVDLVPEEASAASLVQAFAARHELTSGLLRILYPASSRALPTLAAGLRQLGAEVSQVEAYRTEGAPLDVAGCRDWIAREAVGAVTFTSPSAVEELARVLGEADFAHLLSTAAPIAIGRTTARALSARGHNPVVATSATLAGVASTTLRVMQSRS
jgi:uroporphyrinogen III methyltransferase / synthase